MLLHWAEALALLLVWLGVPVTPMTVLPTALLRVT